MAAQPEKKSSLDIPKQQAKPSEQALPFSVNIQEVVNNVLQEQGRKILVAMDSSEYSGKAAKWVNENLCTEQDVIVLVSVWEEAFLEKLFVELDSEIIHPEIDVTHSKHNQLNDTFAKASCFKDHKKLHALLVEAGNRTNPKNIGEELCMLSRMMKVNVLVVGTRGLGGFKKKLLGSVSSYISENAPSTCIVVKD